jgi:hypothetical protein
MIDSAVVLKLLRPLKSIPIALTKLCKLRVNVRRSTIFAELLVKWGVSIGGWVAITYVWELRFQSGAIGRRPIQHLAGVEIGRVDRAPRPRC